MNKRRRVILLEFNELCPPLLDRWMQQGELPNFRKFFECSQVFTTEADEQSPVNLEPWIQWYSIHTGLPYAEHRVFHLTDGPKAGHEDIWDLATRSGRIVWNCGSMNAKRPPAAGAMFLPDPWCTSEKTQPAELDKYQRFVASAVQERSNTDKPLTRSDYASFLAFMVTHGLRAKTVAAVLAQVLDEWKSNGDAGWKRASMLDRLQFDVFRHYFRANRPDFCTFFLNSTAHYQHSYWRHMEPEIFTAKPPPRELARHKDAILFGYQRMDELLADFFDLEDEDTLLILATALSQQPYLKNEAVGGQHFFRPRNVAALLGSLGIEYEELQPVMAHQYLLRLSDGRAKEDAATKLRNVTFKGNELFDFSEADTRSIYFGCDIKSAVPEDATIEIAGQRSPFFAVMYQIEEIKSGCHHPDGVLWIKTGHHRRFPSRVSILDIFPTLVDLLQIEGSSTTRRGRSLVSQIS